PYLSPGLIPGKVLGDLLSLDEEKAHPPTAREVLSPFYLPVLVVGIAEDFPALHKAHFHDCPSVILPRLATRREGGGRVPQRWGWKRKPYGPEKGFLSQSARQQLRNSDAGIRRPPGLVSLFLGLSLRPVRAGRSLR